MAWTLTNTPNLFGLTHKLGDSAQIRSKGYKVMKKTIGSVLLAFVLLTVLSSCGVAPSTNPPAETPSQPGSLSLSYPIVDTGQTLCYDNAAEIVCPGTESPFYGQDAQYQGNQPSYTISADGKTVHDNVTGLTWQRSPDTNGDGVLTYDDKLTLAQAQALLVSLNAANYGGYSDWRLPSVKELYSLINFTGSEPLAGGAAGVGCGDSAGATGVIPPATGPGGAAPPGGGGGQPEPVPFIDTDVFTFSYGFTDSGERTIDSQYISSDLRNGPVGPEVFGVNFADGRIKPYGTPPGCSVETRYFVLLVRGNPDYGKNDFRDNGDGTITDQATGFMWTTDDSQKGMNWEEALAWIQEMNAKNYLGYNDWRLPNAKELQSLMDYSRQTEATGSPAIDPVFNVTAIHNETGAVDYPYYWAATTHGSEGVYVAFGRGLGYMNGEWVDVHGSGTQRSDPKSGDPAAFPTGRGPQGDAIRIYNYVRLVRR
jgi:hypothetical protein